MGVNVPSQYLTLLLLVSHILFNDYLDCESRESRVNFF